MSTQEIGPLSSTVSVTLPSAQIETPISTLAGRDVAFDPFKMIGSVISGMFSNLVQNTSSDTPVNLSKAIAVTRLPSNLLYVIEDYCDRLDEIVKCLQNSETIPEDLQRYAKNIKQLDLNNMKLTYDQALILLDYCKNIESLTFSMPKDNYLKFADLIAKVVYLEKLKDITVCEYRTGYSTNDHAVHKTALYAITLRGALDSFSLYGRKIDDDVDFIINCKGINTLRLKSLNVTDDIIEKLGQLKKLTHLDVSANHQITDTGLVHISKITSLTHLTLNGLSARVSDVGIQNLSELSELEYLDLSGCRGIKENYLHLLYPLKKLKILKTYGTSVTENEIKNIKKEIPGLEVIEKDPHENIINGFMSKFSDFVFKAIYQ